MYVPNEILFFWSCYQFMDIFTCGLASFSSGLWAHHQQRSAFEGKRKAPAKRSQHVNATYRYFVGRNMLRAFGHHVVMCCNMLGVVGSNLKLVKFEPTTPNMSQQGGQTHATCCAQQCCDMLCWHFAIVWPGLNSAELIMDIFYLLTWRVLLLDFELTLYRGQHVVTSLKNSLFSLVMPL